MAIKIPGEAGIECDHCTCSFFVSGNDFHIESTGAWDRSMGPEKIYIGSSPFNCPNCENTIDITYEASEYPKGILNYIDVSVVGGKLITGFAEIDFSYDNEIYSYEEQIGLYLPAQKQIITNLNLCAYDLISEIYKEPRLLYKINPRDFEELIAKIFSTYGFEVEITKQTRDGGRDIIAVESILGIKSKYLIECKRYAATNPVSVELVRSLYGVQNQEGANKSVLATTSYFTKDAKKFADTINTTKWGMDLKDYKDIVSWITDIKKN